MVLIKFSVSNYLSFGEQVTFDLEAGKVRGKKEHVDVSRYARVLKFATMYGANAAGKSNLVSAMHFARNVAVNHGDIPSEHRSQYHRVNPDNANRLSTFEFEMLINNRRYTYGFSLQLSRLTIEKEWLKDTTLEEKTIFTRGMPTSPELLISSRTKEEKQAHLYFEGLVNQNDTLFLREMNRSKSDLYVAGSKILIFKQIYNWLEQKLCFVYPNEVVTARYSFILNLSNDQDELAAFFRKFDIDITSCRFDDTFYDRAFQPMPDKIKSLFQEDIEKQLVRYEQDGTTETKGVLFFNGEDLFYFCSNADKKRSVEIVKCSHGDFGEYYLSEESDGTKRLMELAGALLSDEDDLTFIIDEVDRSLHPLITQEFIRQYLGKTGDVKRQLVITTHEAGLLNTNYLRRDEIWFAVKDKGATDIWRFDSMKDDNETGALARGDIKIEAAYLSGRYSGIPDIMPRNGG